MAKATQTTTKKTTTTKRKITIGGKSESKTGVKVCPYCGQAMR